MNTLQAILLTIQYVLAVTLLLNNHFTKKRQLLKWFFPFGIYIEWVVNLVIKSIKIAKDLK